VTDAREVTPAEPAPDRAAIPPVLEVDQLVKTFDIRAGFLVSRKVGTIQAVAGVSFDLVSGETLAVVGESGSGKTTTAMCILRLHEPTSGSVRFRGVEITGLSREEMRRVRRRLQVVFQDPYASLDPRMTVAAIVAEPLRIHRETKGLNARVDDLLTLVGLKPEHGSRYPREFSGGQRQRVGIARALALEPHVLILDEPVTALDVSIRAGIMNLLEEIQDRLGIAYLLIAHDLAVVRHGSDRVAVMYLGKIVEIGPVDDVYENPAHPYTHALLSAVPVPDPRLERARRRVVLEGDLPTPINPPSGCRFHTRCPIAQDVCAAEEPPLAVTAGGQSVACHFALQAGETLAGRADQLGRQVTFRERAV